MVIHSADCVCSAYPRIFSTDKSKLFIPNKQVPKFDLVSARTAITGDHADDNAYETAHNVDVVDSGPGSNSQLKCTASMDDAIANVAFATEIIDHFGENGAFFL